MLLVSFVSVSNHSLAFGLDIQLDKQIDFADRPKHDDACGFEKPTLVA